MHLDCNSWPLRAGFAVGAYYRDELAKKAPVLAEAMTKLGGAGEAPSG